MFKTIARRFALAVPLMLLAVPASRMHAQPTVARMDVVTGGDPEPKLPPPKPQGSVALPSVVIAALRVLGLA